MTGPAWDEASAFRYGLLRGAAGRGIDPEGLRVRLEALAKAAAAGPGGGGGLGAAAAGALRTARGVGLLGMVGAGALGAGVGFGAAKLVDPAIDPEEARTNELIDTYNLHAREALLKALTRQRLRRLGLRPAGV